MTKEQFDSCKIVSDRRAGNTTRIVDLLVQEFFTNGEVEYWDHADQKENMALNHCLEVFKRRLFNEHELKENLHYAVDRKKRKIVSTRGR